MGVQVTHHTHLTSREKAANSTVQLMQSILQMIRPQQGERGGEGACGHPNHPGMLAAACPLHRGRPRCAVYSQHSTARRGYTNVSCARPSHITRSITWAGGIEGPPAEVSPQGSLLHWLPPLKRLPSPTPLIPHMVCLGLPQFNQSPYNVELHHNSQC